MQRNPCCERAQHKSGTSGVGSQPTFAAQSLNDQFRLITPLRTHLPPHNESYV
ncbi:hypothetical protein NBRC116601_31430 [Cognatishimia sp. WU-CL00825]